MRAIVVPQKFEKCAHDIHAPHKVGYGSTWCPGVADKHEPTLVRTCPCWTDPAYVAKNAYCEACDPNRPARMTDVAARLLEMADEPLELHGLSMTDEQDALLREAAALLREAIVWKAR